jgi:hypothetical protein
LRKLINLIKRNPTQPSLILKAEQAYSLVIINKYTFLCLQTMVININLTPQEIQSLYQASAVTGLSVDELIHNAILNVIEASINPQPKTFNPENVVKHQVYKPGVDPYAPVFEESDWEMLTDSSTMP